MTRVVAEVGLYARFDRISRRARPIPTS
jgi:hypothetical protein